jgi:hypothetical protein
MEQLNLALNDSAYTFYKLQPRSGTTMASLFRIILLWAGDHERHFGVTVLEGEMNRASTEPKWLR